MSCDKKPHSKTLLKHWSDNYPAMLALLTSADSGVKGLTLDEEGNIVSGVRISVMGQEREIVSTERGEYWIILLPGQYNITAQHTNNFGSLVTNTTVEVRNYLGEGAKIQHLVLKPRSEQTSTSSSFSLLITISRYSACFIMTRFVLNNIEDAVNQGEQFSREFDTQ